MPIIRALQKKFMRLYFAVKNQFLPFTTSTDYWEQRYRKGKNSGCGSYNELCTFKAKIINDFVKGYSIRSVIELGCGDGNQLAYAQYPNYLGLDVSETVLTQCKVRFANDNTKQFKHLNELKNEKAQLTLSLDVIYHLIEDPIFESYMYLLFNTATQFVIIYSSNTDEQHIPQAAHVKHRQFSNWIEQNQPQWQLLKFIPNEHPYTPQNTKGSFADFYIYQKLT